LLEVVAGQEKICSYIDVPLHHASASVLKRIKRGGSAEIFLRTIERVRAAIPGVTLRTSFIVGFPGESEKEFDELCAFVREAQFDWMGAFSYSDQEGAAAFGLENKLPLREVQARRQHLMRLQKAISRRKKKLLRGCELEVLLEGRSAESDLLLEGRSPMHAPEIDGRLYITDLPAGLVPAAGNFYPVEITDTHDYDLIARIV
jgi:ribosomal protein S12 methylthiotransferase